MDLNYKPDFYQYQWGIFLLLTGDYPTIMDPSFISCNFLLAHDLPSVFSGSALLKNRAAVFLSKKTADPYQTAFFPLFAPPLETVDMYNIHINQSKINRGYP
jgi:hypothetical protein